MSTPLSSWAAQDKLDEIANSNTRWGNEMSWKILEHEQGFRQHPEAIAERDRLRAAANPPKPQPGQPKPVPYSDQEIADAKSRIMALKLDDAYQKKYWAGDKV